MIPLAHYAGTQIVVAMTLHDQIGPTGAPIPAMPCVDGPVPMDFARFTPSAAEVETCVCTTVFFDGARAIRAGFDVGRFVPHLTLPSNPMAGVHTLFSSHEAPYTVHGVHLEGAPAGTWLGTVLGLACADPVPLPSGSMIPLRGTVLAGMSVADVLHCFAFLAQKALAAAAWNRLTGGRWLGDGMFGETLPEATAKGPVGRLAEKGGTMLRERLASAIAPFERLGDAPLVAGHVLGNTAKELVLGTVDDAWGQGSEVVFGIVADPEPRPSFDHRYHP